MLATNSVAYSSIKQMVKHEYRINIVIVIAANFLGPAVFFNNCVLSRILALCL